MELYFRIKNKIYSTLFRSIFSSKFKSFGKKSNIYYPLSLSGMKNIQIGNNVNILNKVWLAAVPHTGETICEIKIGNGSCLGHFNHIYATNSIIIGENVLTADKVYITDNLHGYQNINIPIMNQPIKQIGKVVIGDGSWLGENVCIIGAKIGKNCVIGANSVVTKDIPDFCVAVGVPANIIKRYCLLTKDWKKTNNKGEFIEN